MKIENYRLTEAGDFGKKALIAGIIGIVIAAIGYFVDAEQFFHSYLTAYAFWASIGLGGLFLTLLHHLVGAEWSIVLRRITESLMMALPIMLILFIPVILGGHHLYEWTHSEVVAKDEILHAKSGYLNMPFFIIRTVVYFVIWFIFGQILYKMSLNQDNGDQTKNHRMRQISAPGMILFALTITYAAYDWMMSLQPHWFSTIFGLWYFGGTLLTTLAFLVVFGLYLRGKGVLAETITVEHYHDLGKLQFAFTIFWAYISFSQFFLIWYANIPEETIFYLRRWEGSWMYVSLGLLLFHLIIPFLVLIPRANKRNFSIMKWIAIWLMAMHWVDLYWNIFPSHSESFAKGVSWGGLWVDAACMLGLGGLFLWFMWTKFSAKPLIPVGDPKLSNSINHVVI